MRGGSFTRGRPPHRVRSPVRPRSWVMCFLAALRRLHPPPQRGARPNPDTLTAGPLWAGGCRSADALCHITPLSTSAFLTSNGSKKLTKWDWPSGGRWSPTGEHGARERPAGSGVLLPSLASEKQTRFLIADVTGSVWLFDAARSGQHLRRWRPGGIVPAGQPTSPLIAQTDSNGRTLIAYTIANRFLRASIRIAKRTGPCRPVMMRGRARQRRKWAREDGGSSRPGRSSFIAREQGGGRRRSRWRFDCRSGARRCGRTAGIGAILTALSDGSSVVIPLPPSGGRAANPGSRRSSFQNEHARPMAGACSLAVSSSRGWFCPTYCNHRVLGGSTDWPGGLIELHEELTRGDVGGVGLNRELQLQAGRVRLVLMFENPCHEIASLGFGHHLAHDRETIVPLTGPRGKTPLSCGSRGFQGRS